MASYDWHKEAQRAAAEIVKQAQPYLDLSACEWDAFTAQEKQIVNLSLQRASQAMTSLASYTAGARERFNARRKPTAIGTFTALEREIVEHRIEVPEAIYEALFDEDTATRGNLDGICAACKTIAVRLAADDWENLTEFEKMALDEAVAGSTYLPARRQGKLSAGEDRNIRNAINMLARRVSRLIGKNVSIPVEA